MKTDTLSTYAQTHARCLCISICTHMLDKCGCVYSMTNSILKQNELCNLLHNDKGLNLPGRQAILNLYAPYSTAFNYIKQTLL